MLTRYINTVLYSLGMIKYRFKNQGRATHDVRVCDFRSTAHYNNLSSTSFSRHGHDLLTSCTTNHRVVTARSRVSNSSFAGIVGQFQRYPEAIFSRTCLFKGHIQALKLVMKGTKITVEGTYTKQIERPSNSVSIVLSFLRTLFSRILCWGTEGGVSSCGNLIGCGA